LAIYSTQIKIYNECYLEILITKIKTCYRPCADDLQNLGKVSKVGVLVGLEQPTILGNEGSLDGMGITLWSQLASSGWRLLKRSSIVESKSIKTLTYIVPFRGREQKFWKYLLTAMKD